MSKKPYYITTAIAYASRRPHIGNTYEVVFTDAVARYKRMQGYDVFFLTGTDEHGVKIEELAKAEGITPKEHVDKVVGEIQDICKLMHISYDGFIRTTDPRHEQVVQKIFKKLYDQGDIYKSEYEGMYCTPCESFWTPSQLVDGKCPDCGREVQPAKEEAYFLRLSKYQQWLEDYIEQHPDFIVPEGKKKEMMNNFIKPGLQDLCVSRTTFQWGIPVTFDPKHVIYVWIDALSNYITAMGYDPDGSSDQFNKYWPCDCHVIGKDIMRFHSIYWPVMLHALGLELPRQLFGHNWILFGEDKMSKSKGNVLYADELAARFGVDAVRYYLLSEMPFAQDGTITYESFLLKYNADLANTLGNLVNRTVAMTNKYFGGTVNRPQPSDDTALRDAAAETAARYTGQMDTYHNADAADSVMTLCKRCNKYIDETAPWVLAKDDSARGRLEEVLYNLCESIRAVAVWLTPMLPATAEAIFAQLGVPAELQTVPSAAFGTAERFTVGTPTPLFARIDVEKTLAELQAEREAAAAAEKAAAPAEGVAFLPQIDIEQFAKTDLRVARVTACEPVPKAKKLLKLTLDDGSSTPRIVCSGIAKWYTPEELLGKSVVLVANLKPAVLCGVESCGMILAADAGDGTARVLFVDGVPAGSRVR